MPNRHESLSSERCCEPSPKDTRWDTVSQRVRSNCCNQDRKLAEQIAAKKASGFFVEQLRPGYVLATLGKGRLTMRDAPRGTEPNGEYSAEWS
jgi:hypothetical protein